MLACCFAMFRSSSLTMAVSTLALGFLSCCGVAPPTRYFYLAECLSLVDLSLTVKSGVQYSLWGGSVLNLGTEAHRRAYFDDIGSFKLPGCFAMTELKHGSNVSSKPSDLLAAVLVAMHARVLFGPL
eukprot:GHRR01017662.1.p1 GENE.GHRR01017662.1~~GHRR01017662.1.p1  ORF type:complete len:127 (+),score=38.88 GHRR01017662.1:660-1040(+)